LCSWFKSWLHKGRRKIGKSGKSQNLTGSLGCMGSGYDFALVKFSGSNPLAILQKSAVALLALKSLHKGKIGGVQMENKDDQIIIIVVYLLDEESGEIALVINCYTI